MNYSTDFKKKLENAFRAKGIAEGSINFYVRNLELLNENKPLKSLTFLNKIDDIEKKLQDFKPNTRRNYTITICSALNVMDKTKSKTYKKFYEDMKNINKELKEKESNNTKTENQEKNWVSWEDVLKIYSGIKEKVEKFKKEVNKAQYNELLRYIILSLYVLLPPRRNDYRLMNIVKKYENTLSPDVNYLSYDTKEFVFNKYKTSKKEGQLIIEIPDDLMEAIKLYLKFQPNIKLTKRGISKTINEPFLVDYEGQRLKNANSITLILNHIFAPKKISSSMLRHIYLSDKFGKVSDEQKEVAKQMSHSVNMQKDYVKKDE